MSQMFGGDFGDDDYQDLDGIEDIGDMDMSDDNDEPDFDGGAEEGMENEGSNEILDIVNSLPLEQQAAVKKYAKSLQTSDGDGNGDEMNMGDSDMEMEESATPGLFPDSREERKDRTDMPMQYQTQRKNPFRF